MPNSVVIYNKPSDLTTAIAKKLWETQSQQSNHLTEDEIQIIIIDMILDSNMHIARDSIPKFGE